MSFSLALEVMGGPMDGLLCRLTGKSACIGRKVGNAMTLALDMRVSRQHAEVSHEGHVWRMRERNCKGGVWINGRRLGVNDSISLEPGQIFFMGNVIIKVCETTAEYSGGVISDDCFIDPRVKYAMTSEFEAVWNQVYMDVKKKGYCEIEDLIVAAVKQNDHFCHKKYESVIQMLSPSRHEYLAKWLSSVWMPPIFCLESGKTMLTPRIWRILDELSKKNRPMTPLELLQGILDEGRSLSACFMINDEKFLKDFGLSSDRSKIPRFFEKPPCSASLTGQIENMEPLGRVQENTAESMSEFNLNDVEFWQEYALRMEKIILGFVKDAMHRSAEVKGFHLPGFDMCLEDILVKNVDVDKNQIKKYVGELEKALVGVLSAYRNGMKEYEKILRFRIVNNLKRDQDKTLKKNSFIGRDREKELQHVRENIFSTLKEVELEGLNIQIIRKRVSSLFTGEEDMS